jgi:hypothetical protein
MANVQVDFEEYGMEEEVYATLQSVHLFPHCLSCSIPRRLAAKDIH